MIAAVIIAVIIMYVSANPVARFVAEHPTTKMLALAFLVLIGVALVADGFSFTSRAATSILPSRFRLRSKPSMCSPSATARRPSDSGSAMLPRASS
jgi:predicted tellurium resistance membrane protein TerC